MAAIDIEFFERTLQTRLNCLMRYSESQPDFTVGIFQTSKRDYIALSCCECFPQFPEFIGRIVLSEASGQQVLGKFVFRSASVRSQSGKRGLHAFTNFISARAGRRLQAYQEQKAIQDRHDGDCNRTSVRSQVGELSA